MKKSPLQVVNEVFGSKKKLVAQVIKDLDRGEEDKSEFESRISTMSNRKLLRLVSNKNTIAENFGSKDKLVDFYLDKVSRSKDADFKKSLLSKSPAYLLSIASAASRKAKKAASA